MTLNTNSLVGVQPIPELFIPAEVCRVLRVKIRKFYQLVRSGRLRALRIGRELRVSSDDLQAFLEEQRKRGIR